MVVASVSATTPTPYEPVHGPTKAFGFSFAESIREELREDGITVTALLPGATDSDVAPTPACGTPCPASTTARCPSPRRRAMARPRRSPRPVPNPGGQAGAAAPARLSVNPS